jgi:hypothetical protein
MANFEGLTAKLIVSALLLISIFSFIVINQRDNNAANPMEENAIFNQSMGLLLNKIDNGTSSANEKYGVFNSEEPQTGFGSIVLFGIVSVGKSFSQIITGFFTAAVKLPLSVLGIPANVYNLITTWLIIAIIVGAWLLYKLGG